MAGHTKEGALASRLLVLQTRQCRVQVNDSIWYGGGADLTPAYLYEEDAVQFHSFWKQVLLPTYLTDISYRRILPTYLSHNALTLLKGSSPTNLVLCNVHNFPTPAVALNYRLFWFAPHGPAPALVAIPLSSAFKRLSGPPPDSCPSRLCRLFSRLMGEKALMVSWWDCITDLLGMHLAVLTRLCTPRGPCSGATMLITAILFYLLTSPSSSIGTERLQVMWESAPSS